MFTAYMSTAKGWPVAIPNGMASSGWFTSKNTVNRFGYPAGDVVKALVSRVEGRANLGG